MTMPELINVIRYLVLSGALITLGTIGALDILITVIKRAVDTVLYMRM